MDTSPGGNSRGIIGHCIYELFSGRYHKLPAHSAAYLIHMQHHLYIVFKWAQSGRQFTLLCLLNSSAKIAPEADAQAHDGPGAARSLGVE